MIIFMLNNMFNLMFKLKIILNSHFTSMVLLVTKKWKKNILLHVSVIGLNELGWFLFSFIPDVNTKSLNKGKDKST